MRRQIANRKSQIANAFTLIELLLVLVILAVLAAVVVPKFTHRSEEAKIAAAKADIAAFDVALDAYEIDNSRFPTSEEGLTALVQAPRSEEHTSELQSQSNLVCRLLLEKKKNY